MKMQYIEILRLCKYGIVGLGINAILYLIYLLIVSAGMDPKLSATITYFCGIILSYNAHKNLVFQDYEKKNYMKMAKFFGVYLSGYFINIAGLYMFVDLASYPHEFVQAGMILTIALYLYLLQKKWIFTNYA